MWLGDDNLEQRRIVAITVTIDKYVINKLLNKYFSLTKACCIIAYCWDFPRNIVQAFELNSYLPPKYHLHLTLAFDAFNVICKIVQGKTFPHKYKTLSVGEIISTSSCLFLLSPFMDEFWLIQVNSSLRNSRLQFNTCHPILPRNHDLIRCVIEHEHIRNMHAGAQTIMTAVRQRFWSLPLQSSRRKIIQKCMICFKANPEDIMGSLPTSQVTVLWSFSHCRVLVR